MSSFKVRICPNGSPDDIEVEADILYFTAPNGDEFMVTLDGERHMQLHLHRDKTGRMGAMALLAKSSNVVSLRSSFTFEPVEDYMHLPPGKDS